MAHVRRKFYDLMEAHRSPMATEAVERIGALYAIEKEIRGRPPEERREVRATRARPLLDSMYQWLQASLAKLSRKSDTAAAVRYALARWDALIRYCDDGRIEIDNSAAERALRSRGPAQLSLCRIGCRGRARCCDLQPDRISQGKRTEPGSLSPAGADLHSGSSGEPDRRPSALEHHAHGERCSPGYGPVGVTHTSESFRKCPRAKYVGAYFRLIRVQNLSRRPDSDAYGRAPLSLAMKSHL